MADEMREGAFVMILKVQTAMGGVTEWLIAGLVRGEM